MRFLLSIICLYFLFACSGAKKAGYSKEILALQTVMSGSFDSSAQALTDSTYYDISMHIYPIWENKKGVWLYVEQGISANPEKPYRQRIYQLEEVRAGQYVSKVYTIDEDERFIGKWKDTSFFKNFDINILSEREGCEVYLSKIATNAYEGGTKNHNCSSSLADATYATSIVTISKNSITSWDRGFDNKDKQAWGAVSGPYVFIRK